MSTLHIQVLGCDLRDLGTRHRIKRFNAMTKEQTALLKGVAILMMLFLHLFNNPSLGDYCRPMVYLDGKPLVYIVSRACSPVGIFLMLSGYGLSYINFHGTLSLKNQFKRLLKLYIHYWITLLVFVSIGCFVRPERYPGSPADVLMNVTSLSSSYNSETWFLFPYMLLSLTSMQIFRCMDRIGIARSLIISWGLYMVSCYVISRYVAPAKAYTEWYSYVLTYFDVLFPFAIGAAFHRQTEKGRASSPFLHSHRTVTSILLFSLFIVNCLISSAATSYLFEFSYIYLLSHININGMTRRFLITMGRHSMVMWLTHSYFCYHLFHDFIYGFRYPLVIYVILIAISYGVSLPISRLAQAVIRRVPFLR